YPLAQFAAAGVIMRVQDTVVRRGGDGQVREPAQSIGFRISVQKRLDRRIAKASKGNVGTTLSDHGNERLTTDLGNEDASVQRLYRIGPGGKEVVSGE